MWPNRQQKIAEISSTLEGFSQSQHRLRGIAGRHARDTLALQMVASLRRLDFTRILKNRDVSSERANPNSDAFDPERAAILLARNGELDEAIWMIFLATHFGRHKRHGWRMLRDVYSGMGTEPWTWKRISSRKPAAFREWLGTSVLVIGGAFGNHRKYETLNPNSPQGTATVVESFAGVVGKSPSEWFGALVREVGNDPAKIFDVAYNRFGIARFGRLAKFDFLALLGRLDLAPLTPGSAYLRGATGPLKGARLLVDGNADSHTAPDELEDILIQLDKRLKLGMQVMEDSLCNWQKSPKKFVHFKG